MTESTQQNPQETGQTPSSLASWSVLGVMIVLVVFSVAFFGGDVAEGPLQVSMTLATLYAMTVAYRYHFRGLLISGAISGSITAHCALHLHKTKKTNCPNQAKIHKMPWLF